MAVTNSLKNQHLLFRAGFGPMAEMMNSIPDMSQKSLWKLIKSTSLKEPKKITVTNGMIGDYKMKGNDDDNEQMMKDAAALRRMKLMQNRDDIKDLNLLWMDEMVNSEAQLREKVAFFWHGHFATRLQNSFFQQELLHIFRSRGLGSFKELLFAVSKSASMMQFLNAQQNKKGKPNENFAREVMELFTMGRGNYSETDIKEAARAFTGWGFDLQGQFAFRERLHDNGSKTVLGKTGNFNGDDVLNILLEQPQTANYIAKKLYRFFVNDNIDEARAANLGAIFLKSNYDIMSLLDAIFESNWFYEESNIASKIKSPIELLVGLRRFLPMQMRSDVSQIAFQKTLGQILFYPPNVAGWPGGKSWIDATTLMIRLRLPQVLSANQDLGVKPKDDDDVMMGRQANKMGKGLSAVIDWPIVLANYSKVSREKLYETIASQLLHTKQKPTAELLKPYIDASSREAYVKSTIIRLMSTPEYQMC